MIAMTEDFEKSISSTNREIKGYVEVLYTSAGEKSNASLNNGPYPLVINGHDIDTSGILDNERKGKNYASLEQDYFKLDGTFVLPNNKWDENPGMAFTTEDIAENVNVPIEILTGWETTQTNCNGISIYFQNNIPLDMEIQVQGADDTKIFTMNDITISSNGVASVNFEEQYVMKILITINEMLYSNQRIRIQEVDFGLSTIFENEDLASFKTIEQCHRFGFDLPVNECTIEIIDFNNKFDFNNPKNLTKYLTKDVIFKPYIGVVTEDNGIEYCPQGWYWFDNYKNEKGMTTFTCKGFLDKFKETAYCVYDIDSTYTERMMNKKVAFSSGGASNGITDVDANNQTLYKLSSGIEMLKKRQIYYSFPYTEAKSQQLNQFLDVDYQIISKGINTKYISTTIKKDLLKDNTKIEKVLPIKNIVLKEYQYIQQQSEQPILYETTVVCNGEETLVYDYEKPIGTTTYIIADDYTGLEILDARNHIYDKNGNLIYTPDYGGSLLEYSYAKIRYNGTITFRVIENIKYDVQINENVIKVNEEGQDITIDNELINGTKSRNLSNYLGHFIVDNWANYNASFEFNGNPAIELGDLIKVENKYSTEENRIYDKVWITKIESEYKGSFNQTIEGDIIEK